MHIHVTETVLHVIYIPYPLIVLLIEYRHTNCIQNILICGYTTTINCLISYSAIQFYYIQC